MEWIGRFEGNSSAALRSHQNWRDCKSVSTVNAAENFVDEAFRNSKNVPQESGIVAGECADAHNEFNVGVIGGQVGNVCFDERDSFGTRRQCQRASIEERVVEQISRPSHFLLDDGDGLID